MFWLLDRAHWPSYLIHFGSRLGVRSMEHSVPLLCNHRIKLTAGRAADSYTGRLSSANLI